MSMFRNLLLNSITPVTYNIYGVKRSLSSDSPEWTRLESGVGKTANATHNGTAVTNDFDSIYPWSDIISYDYDTVNNSITAYYGDNDFTFSPNSDDIDVLTKIPEFWWKRYQENGWEYIYIADGPASGFTKSDEFSIARYLMAYSEGTAVSQSNRKPSYGVLSNARNTVVNKNSDYGLIDYHYFLIQLLYLVEYANYNSQLILGTGIQDNTIHMTGGCDALGMKSGCTTDGASYPVIYRGIEDIFGHFFQTLDGIFTPASSLTPIISYDKDKRNSSNPTYETLSYSVVTGSWYDIKEIGYDANNPLVQLPVTRTNSSGVPSAYAVYICDALYVFNRSTQSVVQFGGARGYNKGQNGLWCVAIANQVTSSYADMGHRIMKS